MPSARRAAPSVPPLAVEGLELGGLERALDERWPGDCGADERGPDERGPDERGPDERGAVALEAVLLVPAVMLLVALFVLGHRTWSARAAVLSAAESGARAAASASGAASGRATALAAVSANLDTMGVRCDQRRVDVDTTALRRPAGTSGTVTVSVTCVVGMSDLLLPGAPGQLTVTRTAVEVVNTFSERRP